MDKTKANILIVDDMKTMRLMVKGSLTKMGFENLFQAEDGVEASRILSSQPINFIVSDWNMPNMSELRLLQKSVVNPNVTNMYLSSCSQLSRMHQIKEAVKSGVDSYIIKPFSHEIFEERLGEIMQKRLKL